MARNVLPKIIRIWFFSDSRVAFGKTSLRSKHDFDKALPFKGKAIIMFKEGKTRSADVRQVGCKQIT